MCRGFESRLRYFGFSQIPAHASFSQIRGGPRESTRIIIACDQPIHPQALKAIAQCHARAAAQGICLEVRKSPDSPPIPLPPSGDGILESIRPVTKEEEQRISSAVATVGKMLQSRIEDARLAGTREDLRLLQRLQDEGALQEGREMELEAVGIVFGRVLAAELQLQWITVEWDGERVLALNYPNTTVMVFPDSMIAKRVDRGDQIDFEPLYHAIVGQINQWKDDPR